MSPNYLCFDVETAPLSEDEVLAQFEAELVKVGNLKDPAKIKEKRDTAKLDFLEDAALHATTGRILCIGLLDVRKDEFQIIEDPHGEGEIAPLCQFWTTMRGWETDGLVSKFIGFNILGFDLPFIIRRSWHHGIPVPTWVWDGRYFNRRFIDLMLQWQIGNRQDSISLDKLARFVGLGGKSHSGKEFAGLYASDHDAAIDYCKNDLQLCADIAQRMML